jgi:DNA-binding LytR/AlgR family response regulator
MISESARDYFKDINVQCFNNGQRLLNQHKRLFFDVIFLDIDMPEFTGFDVAEILRKQNELVYGSMEFQPFYFIQKSSVSRLNKDVVNVLNKLSVYLKQHQKIILSDEEHGRICIQYRDILYIESDNHHVKYCILDEYGSQIHIKVRAVIGDLESELAEYDFSRVHKKYLVNLSHVFNLDMKNDEVIFKQGFRLPMSRKYKHTVDTDFSKYLRETI